MDDAPAVQTSWDGWSPTVPAERSHIAEVLDACGLADRDDARRRLCELTKRALAETGRGLDLTQVDLSGCDMSGFDLRYAILNRVSLYGTSLVDADLSGCSLVCAGLERTNLSNAVLRGAYVHALAAQATNFAGADLSGLVDATGALLHGCDLNDVVLDDAELAGTTFYQCGLSGAHFRSADLHGAMFNECRMDEADLTGAQLDDAMVVRSSLRGTILDGARGRGLVLQRPAAADGLRVPDAYLPALRLLRMRAPGLLGPGLHAPEIDVQDSYLAGADLRRSDLSHGRWRNTTLDRANLHQALLADSSWSDVTAVELDARKATGEGLTATECSFAQGSFAGFAGRYATFRNCDLRAIDLRGAYLYRAIIVGDPPTSACMVNTQLDGANLTQAYLAADFTGARIRQGWAIYARVNQSVFTDADLSGTSLFRSSAVKAEFTRARMSGQRGIILADRCSGLTESLRADDDPGSAAVAEQIENLSKLLTQDAGKST